MTDESILRRIKKCLALSKSANANEAATALRHAQALMRQHDLSMSDVDGIEVSDATVKTTEGFGRCMFLAELSALLRDAFGVVAVMNRNPGSANRANIQYIGPKGRAEFAVYAHQVVTRAVEAAWKEHLVHFPWHKSVGGKRNAFRLGWLVSVRSQIEKVGFSDEESTAINRWKEKTYGKNLIVHKGKQPKLSSDDYRVAQAGLNAGKDFKLHRPMGSESPGAVKPLSAIGVDR